jgi:hypothetical protein
MSKKVSLCGTRAEGSQIVSNPRQVIGDGKLDVKARKLQTQLTFDNGQIISAKTSVGTLQEVILEILGRPKIHCRTKTYQIKMLS